MLAILVALAVAASVPAPASGDITGAVVDSASAKPLSGGEVRITRGGAIVATTTTDAFGRFVVHNLGAGTYLVEIRRPS